MSPFQTAKFLFAARLLDKNSETRQELQAGKLDITVNKHDCVGSLTWGPFIFFIFFFYFSRAAKTFWSYSCSVRSEAAQTPWPWIVVTSCWKEHSGRMSNAFFFLNLWQVVGNFFIRRLNVYKGGGTHPPLSKFFQGNLQGGTVPAWVSHPRAAATRPSVIVQKRCVLLEQSRSFWEEENSRPCGIHTGCLLGRAWRLLRSVCRK